MMVVEAVAGGHEEPRMLPRLEVGDPLAARAVGAANGRNPLPIVVPCHRVIGANGSLTGFGGGLATKKFLLEHEQRHARFALTP